MLIFINGSDLRISKRHLCFKSLGIHNQFYLGFYNGLIFRFTSISFPLLRDNFATFVGEKESEDVVVQGAASGTANSGEKINQTYGEAIINIMMMVTHTHVG